MSSVVTQNPEVLGRTGVRWNSRAGEKPFRSLGAGDSIEQFLEGFPSVKREQVIALLEESRAHLDPALMRILLDENLDWRLRRDMPGHEVESVPLLGWAGIENGELLRKAIEAGFDTLVTMDGNMVHQQDISRFAIAVIASRAKSNRLDDTRPLMGKLLASLQNSKPGTLTFVSES